MPSPFGSTPMGLPSILATWIGLKHLIITILYLPFPHPPLSRAAVTILDFDYRARGTVPQP